MKVAAKDLRDFMIGSAIFSQGQPEDFYKSLTLIEDFEKRGLSVELIDPDKVPDDAMVCQVAQRAGGGWEERREGEVEELLSLGPGILDTYKKRDWSTYRKSLARVPGELAKAIGKDFYSYVTICTSSSQGVVSMYVAAMDGKPCIDADLAGTAMTPHLDTVARVPYAPAQAGVTPYGETVIIKDASPGRAFTFLNLIHYACGSWFVAMASGVAPMKEYKRCIVKNQNSRMIKVGRVVREAREKGRDPVAAFMKAAPAHKLFEGVVEKFTLEKVGGFAQGNYYMKGAGDFKGHRFRVYYNMENRISWLDDKLYVTIPDINATVDSKTCENLPVLDHDGVRIVPGIYDGKEATVLGIANDKIWYELPGAIDGVHRQLKDYGFPDIRHRPIKEVLGAR